MSAVGIKELKNRLTHYVRRTKQGEEIIVTERGKPVALLTSISAGAQATTLEAKLARLHAQGRLTLPDRPPARRTRLVEVSGPPVADTVLEDRR
jgi:prevent-host-death family protein